MTGTGCALGAIALWATLASLGVALANVPPFLLTGLALIIGSVPAWPLVRHWRVPASTLLLGVSGLFGYHFLLFLALRSAPPLEANLVNYLWPLLIVVLAPVLRSNVALRPLHLIAAVAGFAGAALAILGGREASGGFSWGYLAAAGSAVVWASYSLLTQRVAHFPTAAIGLFGLVSGSARARLPCSPRVAGGALRARRAADCGDRARPPRRRVLPLGRRAQAQRRAPDRPAQLPDAARSTLLLALTTSRPLTPWIGAAALLIVGAANVGLRTREVATRHKARGAPMRDDISPAPARRRDARACARAPPSHERTPRRESASPSSGRASPRRPARPPGRLPRQSEGPIPCRLSERCGQAAPLHRPAASRRRAGHAMNRAAEAASRSEGAPRRGR
jgi:hypothetical protein